MSFYTTLRDPKPTEMHTTTVCTAVLNRYLPESQDSEITTSQDYACEKADVMFDSAAEVAVTEATCNLMAKYSSR